MIIQLAYILGLIGVDLVSKSLISAFLHYNVGESFVLIDKIYTLIYAENYGASFGIFSDNTMLLTVFTSIFIVILIVIWVLTQKKNKLLSFSIATIIGGAIGNVYDRLAFGFVRDFIDYTFLDTFFGINFAIGNIADIFLMVGVLMLIAYIAFEFKEGDFKRKPKLKNQS